METTIRLQSIGQVKAIPTQDVQVGMNIMYNYGSTYNVTAIKPKGKQSLVFTVVSEDGKSYEQTVRIGRPIAAFWPKEK